jgi:hypothetical protein
MISVDSLNIQLPGALAKRAENILLLVAQQLALFQFSATGHVDMAELNLTPLTLHQGQSDSDIATLIARSIGKTISAQTAKPSDLLSKNYSDKNHRGQA